MFHRERTHTHATLSHLEMVTNYFRNIKTDQIVHRYIMLLFAPLPNII